MIPVRKSVGPALAALALLSIQTTGGPLGGTGAEPSSGDPELGRRIYREGRLPSGAEVQAELGSVRVSGDAFTCAACHRPSGYGSEEGATPVPPITGEALLAPRRLDRAEGFRRLYQEDQSDPFYARVRDPRLRPGYDLDALDTALRTGRDPAGRILDPWMPRYAFRRDDLEHLAAYLRTLGDGPDPGVELRRIHLATVIGPGVDDRRSRAMLDVMDAFIQRRNLEVEGLRARPGHSPNHRADFAATWRDWKLHVWRLRGPPESWGPQIRDAYRRQPVFALLGGLTEGSWRPIHEQCEALRLPCLFPNTDLPVADGDAGDSTLYLSRGLVGEAGALARHLQKYRPDARVLQVHNEAPRSVAGAEALAHALGDRVETLALESPVDDRTWNRLTAAASPPAPSPPAQVLVAWLGDSGLAQRPLPEDSPIDTVVLSGGLLGTAPTQTSPALSGRILLTWPFAMPDRSIPRSYRVRAWLRSRGLHADDERLQLDTYFTLSVADHAMRHLVTRFDRRLLIERIEHETENTLSPGVYPRLSLGPGQRFASKVCRVVSLSDGGALTQAP